MLQVAAADHDVAHRHPVSDAARDAGEDQLLRLEVIVIVPGVGNMPMKPLEALVEVRRCNEVERGKLYEIGARIIDRRQ